MMVLDSNLGNSIPKIDIIHMHPIDDPIKRTMTDVITIGLLTLLLTI